MSLTLFCYFNSSAVKIFAHSQKARKFLRVSKTFQISKKALKRAKTLKKNSEKKLKFFLYTHFYWGGKNFINKKGLFYAKFFEFEVKS